MTQQEYIRGGFRVSSSISQEQITLAEDEVMRAYIACILPTASVEDEDVRRAVMQLAFIRLLQKNANVTRAGGKVKQTSQAQTVELVDTIAAEGEVAHMYLEVLREKEGANKTARIKDICKIYFETNFLGG